MKPEDILKSFTFFLDLIIDWGKSIINPIDSYNKINIISDSTEKFKVATKLWITAFIISIFVQVPLYELKGIPWSNFGFHISLGISLLLAILSYCAGIYAGLRFFKIDISFLDVYVPYVVLIGIFSPLISILSYPMMLSV